MYSKMTQIGLRSTHGRGNELRMYHLIKNVQAAFERPFDAELVDLTLHARSGLCGNASGGRSRERNGDE